MLAVSLKSSACTVSMSDKSRFMIALILSGLVLLVWQQLISTSHRRKIQGQQVQSSTLEPGRRKPNVGHPAGVPITGYEESVLSRNAAIALSPRVAIDTPQIRGSISLVGARIDDVALRHYHQTVDKTSPAIELLSPGASLHPFYAEFGWLAGTGTNVKVPTPETEWREQDSNGLRIGHPLTLTWNNGQGLQFRRTFSVDDEYLFTIRDEVANLGEVAVTLWPYALISRHGVPRTLGSYILHEGPIGVLGQTGLEELSYKSLDKKKRLAFTATDAWLGITDKYWAAVLLPDTSARVQAEFTAGSVGSTRIYRTDYRLDPITIAPGGTRTAYDRLFAGAKEVSIIDGYQVSLHLNHFDLLIDWGWFAFITKPMFNILDYFYRKVGNFGVAIIIVTTLLKLLFFPLANKSYVAMAKMRALQPQIETIRNRHPGDTVRQQQELGDLYKREKVNPAAGCLPIAVQVPVFFSLYKVLFITIEMRHAPFFGWIKDLSAPDPTTVFNLFGLIPWNPAQVPLVGHVLMVGAWPLAMGFTMWLQMKLNPVPPDPTQRTIANWMPIVFTFMLANFAVGLVIYWAWNNLLSIAQQSIIMRRNGVSIEAFDNVKSMFSKHILR
jgi:YidC/Oxa1 family membrane protein insertase